MFTGKCILAPMVRVGRLPFRLTCLHYGADIVYAEEVIAQRLLKSTKVINDPLGTVDFYDEDGGICFRTSSAESKHVIFQMGVSDPRVAADAAKMIEPYVAGIDVNMGCPKDYSIKGNMGAALLTQPDLVKQILTSLTTASSKPVTCKIRILEDEKQTLDLCRLIESTGVAAISVHGRTRYTRSSKPCNYQMIAKIKACLSIPVILNGASLDIKSRSDMKEIMKKTGVDSIMVARAAWLNPSVFKDPEPVPIKEAVQTFLKLCIDYECPLHILKYTMGKFRGAFKDHESSLEVTRHIEPRLIYQHFGLRDYYEDVYKKRPQTFQESYQMSKRQKLDDNYKLLKTEFTPTILQSFRSAVAPLQILNQWLEANGFTKPNYRTTNSGRVFTGYLQLDNETYMTEGNFKNKRTAIQAVAYAYCITNHIELRHYKTGPKSAVCTDECQNGNKS